MGYSCTNAAMKTLEATMKKAKENGSAPGSNCWAVDDEKYFHELPEEQEDGSYWAEVYREVGPEYTTAKLVGWVSISAAGKIQKWSGMPKKFWNV